MTETTQAGTPSTPADLSKVLVFAGFCLIAAISSTAFIKTLSDRVLKEAQEAKKVARSAEQKASAAQSAIAPIVDREIEEDESVTSGSPILASATPPITEKERRLLEKLAKGKLFRTRTSLAKEIGLAKSEVDQMMEELKQRSLVDAKLLSDANGTKKRRWYITNKGREAITSASDLEPGSPL